MHQVEGVAGSALRAELGDSVGSWLIAMNADDKVVRDRLEARIVDALKALRKIGPNDPCHVERQSVEHDLCCVFVSLGTDETKCINVYPDGRVEEYFP